MQAAPPPGPRALRQSCSVRLRVAGRPHLPLPPGPHWAGRIPVAPPRLWPGRLPRARHSSGAKGRDLARRASSVEPAHQSPTRPPRPSQPSLVDRFAFTQPGSHFKTAQPELVGVHSAPASAALEHVPCAWGRLAQLTPHFPQSVTPQRSTSSSTFPSQSLSLPQSNGPPRSFVLVPLGFQTQWYSQPAVPLRVVLHDVVEIGSTGVLHFRGLAVEHWRRSAARDDDGLQVEAVVGAGPQCVGFVRSTSSIIRCSRRLPLQIPAASACIRDDGPPVPPVLRACPSRRRRPPPVRRRRIAALPPRPPLRRCGHTAAACPRVVPGVGRRRTATSPDHRSSRGRSRQATRIRCPPAIGERTTTGALGGYFLQGTANVCGSGGVSSSPPT
jgi:hypothetical protein